MRNVAVLASIAILIAGCVPGTAPSPSVPSASASASASASVTPSATVSATATASATAVAPGKLAAPPDAEGNLNDVLVDDQRVIVAGGYTGATPRPAILVFEDDAWTRAQLPEARGQVMALAQLGGRYIAVGNELPDARLGFIWESSDGRTWTRAAPALAGGALYDVVATHDVAVAVGARLDEEMNSTATVLTSGDQGGWKEGEVANAAGFSMRAVSIWPQGFAAVGDGPHTVTRPLWTAVDPQSWRFVRTNLAKERLVLDVEGDPSGGLAVVGATDKSGNQHPFVAVSNDGRVWKETVFNARDEGYASSLTLRLDSLVAAGLDADRLTLWQRTASRWQARTIESGGAAIGAITWSQGLGLIAVGTKNGRHAIWLVS
jgi:hypothetical protein